MKLFTIFIFVFAFSLPSFAQTPTLTKGETIEYLDKKLKETIGHNLTIGSGNYGDVQSSDIGVSKTNKGIKIEYKFKHSSYSYAKVSYDFNPLHIKNIFEEPNKSNSSLNTIRIWLIGNVGLMTTQYGTSSGSLMEMVYLRADHTNFNKIKKALEHLRNLYKAEDDPFGD